MQQKPTHSIVEQIEKGSAAGGKSYKFNEKHNKNLPLATWFQNSDEGLVLFIVFYTQACQWSQCLELTSALCYQILDRRRKSLRPRL